MTVAEVKKAMAEAHRFLKAAETLLDEETGPYFYGSKRSGALRRASLDLTRALAQMRRP